MDHAAWVESAPLTTLTRDRNIEVELKLTFIFFIFVDNFFMETMFTLAYFYEVQMPFLESAVNTVSDSHFQEIPNKNSSIYMTAENKMPNQLKLD